jgi:hypothetical protein
MTDLITRLEKEGGSDNWFEDVCVDALGKDDAIQWLTEVGYFDVSDEVWGVVAIGFAIALCERVLPPLWHLEIFMSMKGLTAVELSDVDVNRYPGTVKKLDEVEHKSPATALCIALLRALEDGK